METGLGTNLGPRPTVARRVFLLFAVVLALALVEGARLSWRQAPSETRPMMQASHPGHGIVGSAPARRGPGSDVDPSGRMPIRVSIQRAHARVACASDSRVPIAIMERCERQGTYAPDA